MSLQLSRGSRPELPGVLFAEDFDLPSALDMRRAEPEIVEPAFDAADLELARQDGFRCGSEAARAQTEADFAIAGRRVLAALETAVDAAAARSEQIAAQAAEEIARLLIASFVAVLPALRNRHGPAEAARVCAAILPALRREPSVTVRVDGAGAEAVRRVVAQQRAADRITVVAADGLAPGDVRIEWADGEAVRDSEAVWGAVAAALGLAGLLDSPGSDNGAAHDD